MYENAGTKQSEPLHAGYIEDELSALLPYQQCLSTEGNWPQAEKSLTESHLSRDASSQTSVPQQLGWTPHNEHGPHTHTQDSSHSTHTHTHQTVTHVSAQPSTFIALEFDLQYWPQHQYCFSTTTVSRKSSQDCWTTLTKIALQLTLRLTCCTAAMTEGLYTKGESGCTFSHSPCSKCDNPTISDGVPTVSAHAPLWHNLHVSTCFSPMQKSK